LLPRFEIQSENKRIAMLALLASIVGLVLMSMNPILQDQAYHLFADESHLGLIPNWQNVLSNVPFAIVGLMGLRHLIREGQRPGQGVPQSLGWTLLFTGVFFTAIGSAYYHWHPDNYGLFWDRLPMTVGFSGLFAAMIGERVSQRVYTIVLWPLTLMGIFSAVYWIVTESYGIGDLRMYVFVQFFPLLAIPLLLWLCPPCYTHSYYIVAALVCYVVSKICEDQDRQIWLLTNQLISGHALKHLFAALGCYLLLVMLKRRVRVQNGDTRLIEY
jgi:hypothetical protein